MADSFLHHECGEIFGSLSRKIEDELENFQCTSTLDLKKKKSLNLPLVNFTDIYNEDNSVHSDKSENSEYDETEKIKEYLEPFKEDSGYGTNQLLDLPESSTFDTVSAKNPTNYLHNNKRKLDQIEYTFCAKKLKTLAIEESTFYGNGASTSKFEFSIQPNEPSKKSEVDKTSSTKKHKLWNLPLKELTQIDRNTLKSGKYLNRDSSKETAETYVKIFVAPIKEALINQHKFTSEVELAINRLVSFAEKSLLSEGIQTLKNPTKKHPIIKETFELLGKSQIEKSTSREIGTYLMEELCKSPVICEQIIAHLITKISNNSLQSIEWVHELLFLVHLLEIALKKFRRMGSSIVQQGLKEESYNNYKQNKNRIFEVTSAYYKKKIAKWRKQLQSLANINFVQIQSIVNKCIKLLDSCIP